jgi:peroxiredoxin Q/BCP
LLIADESGAITRAFGVGGLFGLSKRWTFVIDPDLVVREVQQDVDPLLNAAQVIATIARLKKERTPGSAK